MNASTISIKEKKNKRKGLTVSMIFHVALILLALFPFLTAEYEKETNIGEVVVMDFTNFDSASKKSAVGINNKEKAASKKSTPKPVEEVKPQKPKVTPKPAKKPVLTADTPEPPIKNDPVKVESDYKEKPSPVVEKVPEVSPVKEPVKEVSDVVEETTEEAEEAAEVSDATGSTDGAGKEAGGAADGGDDVADGSAGEGDAGMDFSGDGIFGRRVIKHGDVKKVTEREGLIVINLCVDQIGRVIYSKINKEESTITDKSVLRRAELAAEDYRFDKDYTAPKKQCGKLRFLFDLDN